jgi:hypothetical protein
MLRYNVEIYRAQTLGRNVGIGHRPALCTVDVVNGFIDHALLGGGNNIDAAFRSIGLLAARAPAEYADSIFSPRLG